MGCEPADCSSYSPLALIVLMYPFPIRRSHLQAESSASRNSTAPPNIKETTVLYSWVQYRLTHYLEALRKHLPNITEGGNLASVLEHCMVRDGLLRKC